MESALLAFAGWLNATGVGPWMSGSALAYPLVNTLHLLGLVMLVGGIGVVDLRFAGLWRSVPAGELSRALTPIAVTGVVVMAVTGVLLFAADGKALAASATFHRKLVLIALALANAAAFRLLWRDRLDGLPWPGRAMAVASLLLWLAAGTAGRWIAYS